MGDIFRVIKERKLDGALRIADWPVPAEHLAAMIKMIDEGKISGKIAKTLFSEMLASGAAPEAIVREKGLEQVSDTASIEAAVDQVLAANAKAVADYRGGNEKSFGFFVGQVMKATQGKASPQVVNELLKKKLRA
jgi:aspartyl-tRNA(Asn)/glutamyl-tRNA(Gln) amidotransferase subunit B